MVICLKIQFWEANVLPSLFPMSMDTPVKLMFEPVGGSKGTYNAFGTGGERVLGIGKSCGTNPDLKWTSHVVMWTLSHGTSSTDCVRIAFARGPACRRRIIS